MKINSSSSSLPQLGLLPPSDWRAFKIKKCHGLLLIKNPFTSIAQRYWIRKMLKDYTVGNKNNLLPGRFNQNVIDDFWKCYNEENDEKQKKFLKKSYRWTTLGYNYDWNNKIYNEDDKKDFPVDLHELICAFAEILGFTNFKSEAAIINFYPIGTTLAAHTDNSEDCNSPLFSLSFGQSAIFLIGGKSKEDTPLPILLESGDILVMSDESRFNYHAVPRVFKSIQQPWNSDQNVGFCSDLDQHVLKECLSSDKWNVFNKYLEDSRINVNVRQVKT